MKHRVQHHALNSVGALWCRSFMAQSKLLNQKTEETMLSFQRVPWDEQVHLLSLTKSDSGIVL